MGSGISGGGTATGDNLTITLNTGNELTLTSTTTNQIGDALVGAVLATTTWGFSPQGALADAFSDSTGAANTIDTGNTDAQFNTDKYYADFTGIYTDANGTPNNTGSTTSKIGMRILTKGAITITKVTKTSTCNATKCYIYAADKSTLLASADFSGNDATFNYTCTDATNYNIWVDNAGGNWNNHYKTGVTSQASGVNLDYVAYTSIQPADLTDYLSNIASITSSKPGAYTTRHVQTVALTALNGSYTKVRLNTFDPALSTGNTITFDLDYTGGGSWTISDAAVNSWIDLSGSQTFNGAKLKIKLNKGTGGISDLPNLKGYCLMVI